MGHTHIRVAAVSRFAGILLPAALLVVCSSLGAAYAQDSDFETLVEGNTGFAFDLYQMLRGGEGDVFFSPYSVTLALALAYSGARGGTADQMAGVLHFSISQDQVASAFHSLQGSIAEASLPPAGESSGPVELSVANALWVEQTFKLRPDYLELASTAFGAGLWQVDYLTNPELARATINDWVSDKTREKIKNLLGEGSVTSATRLVITNAIYFFGSWASPFDPAETRDEPFNLADGMTVDVRMMHATGYLGYAQVGSMQVVEIPYAGDRLSMVILLPDAGQLSEVEGTLNGDQFGCLIDQLSTVRVALSFPKYKIEYERELTGALASLGMTDAFDPEMADLSGIDGQRDLSVSAVVHKAFVEVTEKGTEAAAATGVVVAITAVPEAPTEVRVDRLFLFAIRDRGTGTILFLGRVMDPR